MNRFLILLFFLFVIILSSCSPITDFVEPVQYIPDIEKQSSDTTITIGDSIKFYVLLEGFQTFEYEWYKDKEKLNGENSPILSLDSCSFIDVGAYSCIVSNSIGLDTSNIITLSFTGKPEIHSQPSNQTVLVGYKTSFSVAATSSKEFSLSYQWQQYDTDIEGETDSLLNVENIKFSQNKSTYRCRISCEAGVVYSDRATLTVKEVAKASQIATGGSFSLYIDSARTLFGAGRNSSNELGQDTLSDNFPTPVRILSDVKKVTAGREHSVMVGSNNRMWVMGSNKYGQLGISSSSTTVSLYPVMNNVLDVFAGYYHTLILKDDNTLWGTGRNNLGQLGNDYGFDAFSPFFIMDSVTSASCGEDHSMFIKSDNSLWAMGGNSHGQLGDGTTIDKTTPVKISDSVKAVFCGKEHTMFIKNDNSLWGMGENRSNQIGFNSSEWYVTTPEKVMDSVTSVSCGTRYTMIIKSDRSLWAVGDNWGGVLGTGSHIAQETPVQVLADVRAVSCGRLGFTVVLKSDNTIWGVGDNWHGQLGNGNRHDDPIIWTQFIAGTE